MVSIERYSRLSEAFKSAPDASTFLDFVYGNRIDMRGKIDWNDANQLTTYALAAISRNDREAFEQAYGHLSRREPSKEADWIYNDILLFSFLIGVKNFRVDTSWMKSTLDFRIQNTSDELKLISQTLLDILEENYESKNNHFPLVVVAKFLLNLPQSDQDRLNATYENLVQDRYPAFDSSLLKIVNSRAIDVIVLSKGLIDYEKWKGLEDFTGRFIMETHKLAYRIVRSGFILLLAPIVYSIYRILTSLTPIDSQGGWITTISLLLGSIPIIVGILSPPKRMVKKVQQFMWRFLGYKTGSILDMEEMP